MKKDEEFSLELPSLCDEWWKTKSHTIDKSEEKDKKEKKILINFPIIGPESERGNDYV